MKLNQILLFVVGILLQTTNLFGQTNCPNGNAENNNLGGWITLSGTATAPSQILTNFVANSDPNRFGLVNSISNFAPVIPAMLQNGIDYYGGFSVPSEGNYSFRLGNNNVGAQAESMSFTFTVNNLNKNFKFQYAVVLNDGGHGSGTGVNPSFIYYIKRGTGILPLFGDNLYSSTFKNIVADANNPFFKISSKLGPSQSQVVYKAWQCVDIDLNNYVGEQVTFVAISRDCKDSGHFGYAYIDGLCQNWPATPNFTLNGNEFCPNHNITMNATATTGEDRYTLEVLECNSIGIPIIGGSQFSETYFNTVPNNIDISNFYTVLGKKKFECGKFYRIKLSVKNDCSTLNELSEIIQIKCLTIDSPNRDVCCGTSSTIGPKPLPLGGRTFNWSSIPQGFSASTSQVTVNPTSMTVYILNVVDYNNPVASTQGCFATDTIIVNPSLNYIMSVSRKNLVCTSAPTYTANFNVFSVGGGCTLPDPRVLNFYSGYFNQNQNNKYNNIKWYFRYTSDPDGCNGNNGITTDWALIGNGRIMTSPNGTGQIKAEYFDPCYPTLTQTYTDNVTYAPQIDTSMIAPNALLPNSSIAENRIVRVWELSDCAPGIGRAPAYGKISDFKLVVFNRWGQEIRVYTKADANRLPDDAVLQGDILWDGKDRYGTVVQDGVYAMKLYFKYCNNILPSWCDNSNCYSVTYGNSYINGWCDVTKYITNSRVSPCMKWSFFGNCQSYFEGCAGMVKAITVIR